MTDDDLRAELLPDREAMSLIGTTGVPGYDAVTLPDTSGLVDAGASASGEESVTDADRSETFSSSDSAYAGPT